MADETSSIQFLLEPFLVAGVRDAWGQRDGGTRERIGVEAVAQYLNKDDWDHSIVENYMLRSLERHVMTARPRALSIALRPGRTTGGVFPDVMPRFCVLVLKPDEESTRCAIDVMDRYLARHAGFRTKNYSLTSLHQVLAKKIDESATLLFCVCIQVRTFNINILGVNRFKKDAEHPSVFSQCEQIYRLHTNILRAETSNADGDSSDIHDDRWYVRNMHRWRKFQVQKTLELFKQKSDKAAPLQLSDREKTALFGRNHSDLHIDKPSAGETFFGLLLFVCILFLVFAAVYTLDDLASL